jgi:hypothetical protein
VFEAARYGIDRLKEIVPVWKKEVGSGRDLGGRRLYPHRNGSNAGLRTPGIDHDSVCQLPPAVSEQDAISLPTVRDVDFASVWDYDPARVDLTSPASGVTVMPLACQTKPLFPWAR